MPEKLLGEKQVAPPTIHWQQHPLNIQALLGSTLHPAARTPTAAEEHLASVFSDHRCL